jgi:MerR family mercuric resistance operon transcriptional regulator
MARARVAALDAKIEELQAARRSLSKLADLCAKPGGGACPILTAFEG